MTDDDLTARLEDVDRLRRVEPEALVELQAKGWINLTTGLTEAGHKALYRRYRGRIIALERESAAKMDEADALKRAVRALNKVYRGQASGLLTKHLVKVALEEEFSW